MIERVPRLELTTYINAAPADVFSYFVDPALYVRWQGTSADLEPRPGGRFRVFVEAGQVAAGEYVAIEPPRRVVFTWGWEGNPLIPAGSSTVEITLEAAGAGTLVRLRHTGLPDQAAVDIHSEGWNLYLERLSGVAGRNREDG